MTFQFVTQGWPSDTLEPFRPYYTVWEEYLSHRISPKKISVRTIYTTDDLVGLPNISKTTIKKIQSAKSGTFVHLSKLSATRALGVVRLDESQLTQLDNIQRLEKEISEVREQIRQFIPEDLSTKLKNLEKDLKKLKKDQQ